MIMKHFRKNYDETGKRVIRTISLTREQELGYMKVLCVLESISFNDFLSR